MNQLTVHNLSCSRGNRIVFYGVDFSVHSGQTLRLAGRNGSGKSTLLRALAGLIEPLQGHIKRPEASWLLLDHKDTLKSKLTLYENLKFWSSIYRISSALIDEALKAFALYHLKDLPVQILSLGQRQRLSLCRLMLSKAHTWLLDEPARSLDQDGKKSLMLLLQTHLKKDGIVVLASHESTFPLQGIDLDLDLHQTCNREAA